MVGVNGDELTRQLIDEGARLLADRGPGGLSLRKLAAAVGTSTMAVYTRFGDKQGLLAAMHREGFQRLGDRLQREAAPGSLLGLGRAYREAALQSPHLYQLMFGPPPAGFEPGEVENKAAAATYAPMLDAVRAAVEQGDLVGDPDRVALHLWVVAHGMVSLELSGQLPGRAENAAARYDDALRLAAQPFMPRT